MQNIIDQDLKLSYGKINAEGRLVMEQTTYAPLEMNQAFLDSYADYFFIRDHYDRWKHANFQSQYGKPFSLKRALTSMFFDDNVDSADKGDQKDIIHPFDEKGNYIAPVQALKQGKLFKVNSLDAILDEDYFLRTVRTQLRDI